jgi:hypothetical protein
LSNARSTSFAPEIDTLNDEAASHATPSTAHLRATAVRLVLPVFLVKQVERGQQDDACRHHSLAQV